MNALLYLPGHSRDDLVRALRIPALSPGWQTSLRALLEQADDPKGAAGNPGLTAAAGSPPPAWQGFRSLVVTRIARESDSVLSVELVAPDGVALPAALPGQFLTLRLRPTAGSPPLIRSYSLSGPPGAAHYRISVKREAHGAASGFLHAHLQAGATLEVAAPRGTFTLRDGDGPVLLLSAGVGATPVLAMLHALAAARSTREVWWVHGARNHAEHPFADESRALLARLPNGARERVLQPSRCRRSAGTGLRRWPDACPPRCWAPSDPAQRGGVPVRAGGLHAGARRRPVRTRPGGRAHSHRDLRRRTGR